MIYHIVSQSDWMSAKTAGVYEPESLKIEGFVHCCTAESFTHIANFYFAGREGFVVLEIDESILRADVRWQEVGAHKFPHIYGPIHLEAVKREAPLEMGSDGLMTFPFEKVLH